MELLTRCLFVARSNIFVTDAALSGTCRFSSYFYPVLHTVCSQRDKPAALFALVYGARRGRLKSAKEVHVPECEDVAPRCALLDALKETSVRDARVVATFCPFENKKGDGLCFHVDAKGKKLTHDTP